MEVIVGTPEERALLALLMRDAKIWHSRTYAAAAHHSSEEGTDEAPVHKANLKNDGAFIRKRPTKNQEAAKQRAEKEARIANFVIHSHAYVPRFNIGPSKITYKPPVPTPTSTPRFKHRSPTPTPVRSHRRKNTGTLGRMLGQPSLARKNALAAGEDAYLRERPCNKCGGQLFRTKNYTCVECERKRNRGAAIKLKRNNALAQQMN